MANAVESFVRRIDGWQQRHLITAFIFAVTRKFGDDRGGALAALLTYYGFVALFPALLALFTIMSFLVPHYPALEARVTHSVLSQFPVIGPQLQLGLDKNIRPLHGNPLALLVGTVGALWGSLGASQIGRYAMNEVWDVPGRDRPGFFPRLARSVLLSTVAFLALIAASAVTGLGLRFTGTGIAVQVAATVITIATMIAVFRLSTSATVPNSYLIPGAVGAALGVELLQTAGVALVRHQLRHASNVYGTFGLVIGLISLLYIFSQIVIYAAEANAVFTKRLWPRSIVQPPLTRADKRALVDIALREQRRQDQTVDVHFDADSRDAASPDLD